jgi:TatD DNase family protein
MAETLFDSHCHFDFAAFDNNRDSLWQQCQANNITELLIPGIEPAQWPKAKAITATYSGCYFATGLHPWWVEQVEQQGITAEKFNAVLEQAIEQLKPIAIGECGLDKNIDCPIDKQIDYLNCHIELANQHQLPLILHSVKTHNELLQVLKNQAVQQGGIIHAFSGSVEQAEAFTDKGFLLGIGGVISYPRAKKTMNTVKHINLEHLVLETDAPDMPLDGFQGQNNTPLQLPRIAAIVADIKGLDVNTVIQQTRQNCHKIFGLAS